jgi:ribose transport system substrate-binding protein
MSEKVARQDSAPGSVPASVPESSAREGVVPRSGRAMVQRSGSKAGNTLVRATVIYPSTQGADGVRLARLLVQKEALGDLVEVEVPRTVQLYAPVVTKDNVDQCLPTAFE